MTDLFSSLSMVEKALLKQVSTKHIRNLLELRYPSNQATDIDGFIKQVHLFIETSDEFEDLVKVNETMGLMANEVGCYWTMAPNTTGGTDWLVDNKTNQPVDLVRKINEVSYSSNLYECRIEALNNIKSLLPSVKQIKPNLLIDKLNDKMWVPSTNVLIIYAFEEYKEMVKQYGSD